MGVGVVVGLGSLVCGAGLHRIEPRFEKVLGFGTFEQRGRQASGISVEMTVGAVVLYTPHHTTPHHTTSLSTALTIC